MKKSNNKYYTLDDAKKMIKDFTKKNKELKNKDIQGMTYDEKKIASEKIFNLTILLLD